MNFHILYLRGTILTGVPQFRKRMSSRSRTLKFGMAVASNEVQYGTLMKRRKKRRCCQNPLYPTVFFF